MRFWACIVVAVAGIAASGSVRAEPSTGTTPSGTAPVIASITDAHCVKNPTVAVGRRLFVTIETTGAVDPASYVLFLDGLPVQGLDAIHAGCSPSAGTAPPPGTGLVFGLRHTDTNAPTWRALLGAPTSWTIPVTVALGTKTNQGALPATPSIFAGKAVNDTINLQVTSKGRAIGALIAIAVVVGTVWIGARYTALLRDNLLPQIAPNRQTYSLGRWQMAFWFTLVFAAFVVLYVVLIDYNTITQQDVWLVGISGTTGVAAIAIDIVKDTPADAANRGLRALGLNTYADVLKLEQAIENKKKELAKTDAKKAPDLAKKLALEINDQQILMDTYKKKIRPFVSEGWFRDLTTDLNGVALHRLQTVFWTLALGFVFVIGVYTDLAMPQFSATVLLLTGVSGAGYVGFKYPEPQQ